MENVAEYLEVSLNRSHMFSFLAELYRIEMDDRMIRIMKDTPLPEFGSEEFMESFAEMKKYLSAPVLDIETDLAVDYATVFLGAGKTETSMCAYPYESVYTSPEKLIMQQARDDVLEKYHKFDLDRADKYQEPEDHIFFELEFMSELCRRLNKSERKGDMKTALEILREQKDFIEQHLLNWIPKFAEDVNRVAATDFYKGLANTTVSYLKMDVAVVEELLTEYS